MLANFLIGLREGLEASLIVGILVAYCIKSGRKNALPGIFWGTLIAILFSIGVGVLLSEFVDVAPKGINEIIAGFASILAVVFVTWMIFWMARQSKNMRQELHDKVDQAGEKNLTLILVAFFAVIREGVETAVFLWSASRATGADTNPVLGATLGLAIAAILGFFVYKGALKLNLRKFFQVTGAFLIIVAAGIL
ncbi:MAG: FTR1 family protein, partial [Rhodoluna sp.]